MPLQVRVTVSGDSSFLQRVGRVISTGDFSKPLKEIGDELVSYYSGQVFASQGGVLGDPWARLAPATMLYKSKHYTAYAAIPLIATGTMKNSFQPTVTSRQLTIGNTAPYFMYHQSSAPRTKLPRRQMLGVNDDVKQIIKQIITRDLNSKLGAL